MPARQLVLLLLCIVQKAQNAEIRAGAKKLLTVPLGRHSCGVQPRLLVLVCVQHPPVLPCRTKASDNIRHWQENDTDLDDMRGSLGTTLCDAADAGKRKQGLP